MSKKADKKKGAPVEEPVEEAAAPEAPTTEAAAPEAGPQEETFDAEGYEAVGDGTVAEAGAAAGEPELVDEPAVQLPAFDADEPYEYLEALGIQREDVLALKPSADLESVTVITRGGVKLVFPGDEEKALKLTDAQRDGEVHQTSHTNHLFKK